MPFLVPLVVAALVAVGVGAATAAILAPIIVGAIVSIGLSLISSLLFSPNVPKPADGHLAKRQPIPPRIRAFGRTRLSGAYMLYETAGGKSMDVLAVADGLMDGIETYFLHDDIVTLDGSGFVQPLPDGSFGTNKIRFMTRLGLDTETAYAPIVSQLPAIWTAFHRGDGIVSIGLICGSATAQSFNKVYPNGLPIPGIAGRFRHCFDPRASGMDPDDQSTWTWSDNPTLALLTYLITDMGEDYALRILPEVDSWITSANVCDEEVTLNASGSEKRYRLGGFYQADNDPADVIAIILSTFDGWLGETGSGALKVFAGAYYVPTITIGPEHNIAFHVQRYVEDENAINEIKITYVDPAQKYVEVETDSWRDEADIASRGKVRTTSAQMAWVQSKTQARRLAKREMMRLTSDARGTIKTDLFGLVALGERYVNLNIPELPSLCTFPVQVSNTKINLAEMSVTFDWVKVSSEIDDWNPLTEEGASSTPPTPADPDTIPDITGLAASSNGTNLFVTFDTPTARDDLDFVLRYRTSSGPGEWVTVVYTSADTSGPTVTLESPAIHPNTSYDVEVAGVAPGGTYGNFAGPVTVDTSSTTTPSTPTGFRGSAVPSHNELAWNANPEVDSVTGFKLYRAPGLGASFGSASLIATLGVVTGYSDSVYAGASYTYFLKATNANGDSSPTSGLDISGASGDRLRVAFGTPGRKPDASEKLLNPPFFDGDVLPAGSGGAFAYFILECDAPGPTADWDLTFTVGGATVATGTILAGATSGSSSGLAGDLVFATGDTLIGECPTIQDATLTNVRCAIAGTRNI